jgi:hypothetical protein
MAEECREFGEMSVGAWGLAGQSTSGGKGKGCRRAFDCSFSRRTKNRLVNDCH